MVDSGENRRLVRVSKAVREELAQLLVKETNDPHLDWVTLTDVKISADLRHARIFYVATGSDDSDKVHRSLEKAAPFLRRELGRRLRLRYTPNLNFLLDSSFEHGERIDQLIREVNVEKEKQHTSESETQALSHLIDRAELILVATHRNPDGDAIGSLLGLCRILDLMGKPRVAYCPDGVPKVLSFLPGVKEVVSEIDSSKQFDLTIVLDTADENLLPDGFPEPQTSGDLVIIDHHARHGEIGDLVIRRDASAVGESLFDLSRELVWPIDMGVAECLYTSIVADTGSFRYSSTTPKTHRIAAELIDAGARPWTVATQLYESYPLRRQRLHAKVLETLNVSDDGRFAHMFSSPEMIEQAGARKEDLDGMVNFGRSIEGVEISAMFRVEENGDIKVSFRSKGRIDIGKFAAGFSGGGHRNAAGCTLQGVGCDEAQQIIGKAVEKLFAEIDETGSFEPIS